MISGVKMNVNERLSTLVRTGIDVKGNPKLTTSHDSVICEFDDGRTECVGIVRNQKILTSNPLYRTLAAEVGLSKTEELLGKPDHNGKVRVRYQVHVIKDFDGSAQYFFRLPALEYIIGS